MKGTGKGALLRMHRAYSLLSSSMSSFFCVPFGGYAILSCNTKHSNSSTHAQPIHDVTPSGAKSQYRQAQPLPKGNHGTDVV